MTVLYFTCLICGGLCIGAAGGTPATDAQKAIRRIEFFIFVFGFFGVASVIYGLTK